MDNEQMEFPSEIQKQSPVICLGMEFENDEARRKYFCDQLREKLKDPEFRAIEGFPIGADEDIIALSDPPYYTACPNPWIADFIKEWKSQDTESKENFTHHRKPFAADVSEGKYDPLYKIHAYPTKVPFRAIIKYILHYSKPGDLIYDGFCGTGMTGVAALMCGSEAEFRLIENKESFYEKGIRKALLCDLSTNATHIASNYTKQIKSQSFQKFFSLFIESCEALVGWVYESYNEKTNKQCNINYTVWSEVFICEHCSKEYSYWDSSVSYKPGDKLGVVNKSQTCPHCAAEATRRTLTNAFETVFDPAISKTVKVKKHIPVLLNCSSGKVRFEKFPEKSDAELLSKIYTELSKLASSVKTAPLMLQNSEVWGDLQRVYHLGITHAHHFFTARNLLVVTVMRMELEKIPAPFRDTIRFLITASFNRINCLVRYMPQYKERNVGPLSGTLYKPMLFGEINVFTVIKAKVKRASEGLSNIPKDRGCVITTQSSGSISKQVPDNSVDYIFTDPPFGDNLPYSELNFNEETWLGVHTNNIPEAIVSGTQNKKIREYQQLITDVFRENFRIIKPGRWMTVVFHNSQNRVWNSIQEALFEAGFVVADVRTLDKKRGTTKQQVYTSGAVKQDLVISAYKPNGGLEDRFTLSAGTEDGVWDFIRTHLSQLPIFLSKAGQAEIIVERQNFLLFDRMIAFHVQRGVSVSLSAADFYLGLSNRFIERDGMYFLSDQAVEYDKKRITVDSVQQLALFVNDEASALQWLRQLVKDKPQSFQDINPQFMKEISGWSKYEKPLELSTLLEQNFLCYEGKGKVPDQIHSYLSTNWKDMRNLPKDDPPLMEKAKNRWYVPDPNKAGDLEKLREKSLLREFEQYKESRKKLKLFRIEAVRAGFKKAWQERNYSTIISIAEKIPGTILEEDPKLLMWYDQAITRQGTI
jgi:DNA modification methylase